jgi:hypothetical protein
MAIILSDLIANTRIDLNDSKTSHFQRSEVPLVITDGTNLRYFFKFFPLTGKTINKDVFLYVDGVNLSSGYTIDEIKGEITLAVAPISSIITDYYFFVFTDEEILSWIQSGVENCGQNNISVLPDVLTNAIKLFAFHYGCKAWARKWAEGFIWKFGQEEVDKDKISKKYQEMAKDSWDQAIQMRDDYYIRYGQRNAPSQAYGTIPFTGYTPIR